jgi:hypothetical protein
MSALLLERSRPSSQRKSPRLLDLDFASPLARPANASGFYTLDVVGSVRCPHLDCCLAPTKRGGFWQCVSSDGV